MDPAVNASLQQGIAAARAGRRSEARTLLTQVVEADERNEQGWLWLAGVVDDPADVRTSLRNVLDLNPNNAAAKKGLAWADQRFGPEPPTALRERAVGEPEAPAAPPDHNAMTTTTLSLEREQFEQAAAQHLAAPRPSTTRLREPVFDPLSIPAASPSPPAPQPSARLREAVFDPLGIPAPAKPLPPPVPASARSNRPAAPTMLMEAVSAQPVPPVPVPATQAVPSVAARPTISAPEVIPSTPAENPCPFCGAPTTLKQQRCTQCRQSLMVRAVAAPQRSLALTVLGAIWIIGGIAALLGTALIGVLLFMQRQASGTSVVSSGFLAIVLAAVLLFGLLCFGVARGLWARVREFYFLNIALIVVGIVVRVGVLLRGTALLASLVALASRNSPYAGVLTTAAAVLPLALGILLVLLPLILSVLSYRDFFPPMVRFVPTAEKSDHMAHYNRGLGYRDQGMWYMAVQEWFTAARMRPAERAYLPTLGLGYAQMRQLYPNAKVQLSDVEAFLRGRKAELYAAAPELEKLNLL